MKDDRGVLTNWVYRHFKGGLYYVDDVATDEATNEEVVIYRGFDDKEGKPYGKKYVRKVSSFKEIIINKYDIEENPKQQYFRFDAVIPLQRWRKNKKKKKERRVIMGDYRWVVEGKLNALSDWDIVGVTQRNDELIIILEKEIEEDE